MEHESQAAESAVVSTGDTHSHASDKSRAKDFLLGIVAVFYEFFSFIIMQVVRASVIFGTYFHTKVLVPLGVFSITVASLVYDLWNKLSLKLRCMSHKLNVAAVHFRDNRFVLAVTMLAVTFMIMSTSLFSIGIKIIVDGEELGYMYSRDEYNEALSLVEARASEILERPYIVTSNVRFELGVVSREKIISKDELRSYFFSKIDEVSRLYVLTVDGEVVGASYNRETLQAMIDELLHTNDPNVKARFAQEVLITQKYVDAAKIISYDEIRQKLTSKIHSTREYEIQPGDTIESIAAANGMTSEDILELNPSIKPSKLRAGRTVVVGKEVPFLSIEAVRRVEYTETIPYETKRVEDDSIYKGTTKVVNQGRVGTRTVVADVTYVDNKETSRTVISSAVTSEPVTKVIHVGTKERPKTVATGKLSRPVRGAVITSNFGMRRGGMHRGVDFAAGMGTRISAADGGTVTWAGWKRGGWGYLVVINHGNGIETYYAHNSKVTVEVGQKVAKGEQIAKMGSTGNSTGPHCHFEIHVNGRYVNPWKYIS